MEITIRHNIDAVTRRLTAIEREQLPFATALALTRTAQVVQRAERKEIGRVFDRPKPFTKRGVFYEPARKQDRPPRSNVYLGTMGGMGQGAGRYLRPQVHGGTRRHKRFEQRLIARGIMKQGEFAVPARGYPIDRYGNLRGAVLTRVLSGLSASSDAHQWVTAKSKRRNRRRAVIFASDGSGGLPRGVFERKGGEVRAILIFVTGVSYRKRLDFYGLGERVARQAYAREFRKAFAHAMRTARAPASAAAV